MTELIISLKTKFGSKIFSNSFWGLTGSMIQNIFLSLFYLLIVRHYNVDVFAQYIIASSLYQMFVAFSSLGLGQWFIRESVNYKNKNELTGKFLKMQTYFGLFFFLINFLIAFLLYDNSTLRILSLLFASNIIFDNIIYAIKSVNIAQFEQKKTVIILSIEAVLKFLIACCLFIYPFSIITLTLTLVIIRFLTLNLFLKIGVSNGLVFTGFWKANISRNYIKTILKKYWPFAIIGSTYIIYWKSATLIISKLLSLQDVAYYENSFKIFSLAQLVPIVLSTTLLPKFVQSFKENNINELKKTYKKAFYICLLYGLGSFTFTYSFADLLIPLAFGEKYALGASYTVEMFLTMTVLPTSLIQAQLLIAMKLEKLDMWFNINSVIINLTLCLIGLYFLKSLSVINYSIFISFILFHFSQDTVLIRKKIISKHHVFSFIIISISIVLCYYLLSNFIIDYILFPVFWSIISLMIFKNKQKFKVLGWFNE